MFIDSHCHLNLFGAELPSILARAHAADIHGILSVCARQDEFPDILHIAETHANTTPTVWASVGIHPSELEAITLSPEAVCAWIIEHAKHPRVIGIGETGIDVVEGAAPLERQKAYFLAHIHAAQHTGLPIILHTRNGSDIVFALLKDLALPIKGVWHCFTGDKKLVECALAYDFSFGIPGIVTFKNAHILREALPAIPPGHLLLETDAPWLAPVPYRGKPNEPAYMRETARCVASEINISLEQLKQSTTEAFFRLFKKAKELTL